MYYFYFFQLFNKFEIVSEAEKDSREISDWGWGRTRPTLQREERSPKPSEEPRILHSWGGLLVEGGSGEEEVRAAGPAQPFPPSSTPAALRWPQGRGTCHPGSQLVLGVHPGQGDPAGTVPATTSPPSAEASGSRKWGGFEGLGPPEAGGATRPLGSPAHTPPRRARLPPPPRAVPRPPLRPPGAGVGEGMQSTGDEAGKSERRLTVSLQLPSSFGISFCAFEVFCLFVLCFETASQPVSQTRQLAPRAPCRLPNL